MNELIKDSDGENVCFDCFKKLFLKYSDEATTLIINDSPLLYYWYSEEEKGFNVKYTEDDCDYEIEICWDEVETFSVNNNVFTLNKEKITFYKLSSDFN